MLRAFLLLVLFTSTIIAGFYIFRDKKPDEEIFTSQDESENSSIKDNFTDNPSSYPYPGNQVLSIEPKKIVTNDNPVNEKQQSTKQKKIKKVDTNDNPINEIEQKAKQNDIPTIIVLLSLFISLICIIITFLACSNAYDKVLSWIAKSFVCGHTGPVALLLKTARHTACACVTVPA